MPYAYIAMCPVNQQSIPNTRITAVKWTIIIPRSVVSVEKWCLGKWLILVHLYHVCIKMDVRGHLVNQHRNQKAF